MVARSDFELLTKHHYLVLNERGMGGSSSTSSSINKEWMAIFNAMQFTNEEIKVFQEIFTTVDADHSGSIEITELLDFLHIEESIFTERIFSAFDRDGTGKVDFFEFVVSLWKFCAMGKESISMFAFDLYDTDCDGALTETEVRVMFHDLYWYGSKAVEDEASRRTLGELLSMGEGTITIEGFRPFCQTHTVLLLPLLAVQGKLRTAAMGTTFWENMSGRKLELKKGHSVALRDLLVQPADRDLFYHMLFDKSNHRGLRQRMQQLLEKADPLHLLSPDNTENPSSAQQHHNQQQKQQRSQSQDSAAQAQTTTSGAGMQKAFSSFYDPKKRDSVGTITTITTSSTASSDKVIPMVVTSGNLD